MTPPSPATAATWSWTRKCCRRRQPHPAPPTLRTGSSAQDAASTRTRLWRPTPLRTAVRGCGSYTGPTRGAAQQQPPNVQRRRGMGRRRLQTPDTVIAMAVRKPLPIQAPVLEKRTFWNKALVAQHTNMYQEHEENSAPVALVERRRAPDEVRYQRARDRSLAAAHDSQSIAASPGGTVLGDGVSSTSTCCATSYGRSRPSEAGTRARLPPRQRRSPETPTHRQPRWMRWTQTRSRPSWKWATAR